MRARGDLELHPFTIAFGDLAATFGAYNLLADRISVPGFGVALDRALPWLGLMTIFLLHALNLTVVRGRSATESLRAAAVSATILGTMALTGFALWFGLPVSLQTVGLPVIAQTVAILGWRFIAALAGRLLRGRKRILLVGSPSETRYIATKLEPGPEPLYELTAAVTGLEEARRWLDAVNCVMVAPSVPYEERTRLLDLCLVSGRECLVVPDSYELSLCQAEVRRIQDLPVLAIHPIGLSRGEQAVKRAADLVAATVGILLLLPVWLVVAILIKLTSPGPVFYRQERVGRGGRIFSILKFRTMRVDAEAETGPVLAAVDDPRVTPVGRFLRAIRLDETPQLLNVIKGDMSVVGPRPERPFFMEQIARELPEYRYRLLVRPGLTGLAQVEAGYSTPPEDKLRYDLLYIQNYSIVMDIQILLATFRVVLFPSRDHGVTNPRRIPVR